MRLDASTAWFALHGLVSAGAVVSVLFALHAGELSVVSPIVASQPVAVVLLSAVVLRHLEELRAGTIVGACIAFAGVAMLSVS